MIRDLGNIRYWNRGTDHRFGGVLGWIGAFVQTLGSYYSSTPPRQIFLIPLHRGGRIQVTWPPYIGIFVDRGDPWYRSFRIGWRWDPNCGDGNNPFEPVHHPQGAKILDAINKTHIDHVVGNT